MNSVNYKMLNIGSLPPTDDEASNGLINVLSKKQQEGYDYYNKHMKVINTKYYGMWIGIADNIIYSESDYFNLHKKLVNNKVTSVFIIQVGKQQRFLELNFNSDNERIIEMMRNCEIRADDTLIWFESE